MKPHFANKFNRHSQVPGSVLRGNYWGIFSDGALVPVKDHEWHPHASEPVLVFYAEREVQSEQPKDSAAETFRELSQNTQKLFKTNPAHDSVYPHGLYYSVVVEVILANGEVEKGEVGSFTWSVTDSPKLVKYYRKL